MLFEAGWLGFVGADGAGFGLLGLGPGLEVFASSFPHAEINNRTTPKQTDKTLWLIRNTQVESLHSSRLSHKAALVPNEVSLGPSHRTEKQPNSVDYSGPFTKFVTLSNKNLPGI